LGIDAIDVWLLHEATADHLDGSDLLAFLRDAQQRRLIGDYGLGADRRRVSEMWERHRDYCSVLQFEWSPLEKEEAKFPGAFVIHHRAISGAFDTLRRFLEQDSNLCRQWSDAVDLDLSDGRNLTGVLLQAALAANPQGMVLFSSRAPEHIRTNVHAAEQTNTQAKGSRFLELVAKKRREILAHKKS
jgi:aryl-alcohol dehydrogenase-like predicted oxidoreductase